LTIAVELWIEPTAGTIDIASSSPARFFFI